MVCGVMYGDLGENGLRASTLVRGGDEVSDSLYNFYETVSFLIFICE
jgi:hypothetical protein